MDPKQTAQLDPKFQEAYNRVMGTVVSPAADPTAQPGTVTPPVTPQPAVVTPPVTPQPVMTQPVMPPSGVAPTSVPPVTPGAPAEQPLPVAPVVMPHSTETVRVGGSTPIEPVQQNASSGVVAQPTKKGISPMILLLAAIVFLLIYSIFWVRFLNVPIPFLNQ